MRVYVTKPPPSEIVITEDNVGQYFKVTGADPMLAMDEFRWSGSIYQAAVGGGGIQSFSLWTILNPNKYLICFDYDGRENQGSSVSIDSASIDIQKNTSGSIEREITNEIAFRCSVLMQSSNDNYFKISNIRLKPIP